MFSLVKENIRIAFDSIRTQLLRTILTVLIIAIGITALVGILSSVNALQNTISSNFSSMGANSFNLQRYNFTVQTRGKGEVTKVNPVITYRDAKNFKDNYLFPDTRVAISFTGTSSAEIKHGKEKTDPEASVLGVNENYLSSAGLDIESGRDFSSFDIQNNSHVCVIGADFQKGVFRGLDPTHKTISVRGAKFKVIGVLKNKGSTFGNNEDLKVYIPIQVGRSMFTMPDANYRISVKVGDQEKLQGAQDDAIMTFRNIRKLKPKEENNFGIERSDSLLNQINQLTSVLNISAWVISMITILGSSIALMNIMLVSVTERTREIGIRKALGAKKNTIAFQFFIETVIIGQLGGILGILLGMLIGYFVASTAGFEFSIPWMAIISATVISFLIAVVSGSYPAIKASRQNPIESLRYE